jgi:hypothetical protein
MTDRQELEFERRHAAAVARDLAATDAPADEFTLAYLADTIAVARAVTEEGMPRSAVYLPRERDRDNR